MSKKSADETQLKAIYYDKNVNTSSAKRLYDAVKDRGLNIEKRLRDIEKELEDDEYEVEKIVGRRKRKGKFEYRVKWKGYPSSSNTWQPRDNSFRDLWEAYDRSLNTK